MDQREALYEYLRQKSAKRQDPMQDAYKLSDAGNLLGAFSEAASMSGQLQGKRAESDIIPTVNKGLYQTSKDAANAEIALEDQQTKRLKLMQYLSEKSKPSKMQLQKDLMSPTGNPVLMDEYGQQMRELPGYKIRERAQPMAAMTVVPGYEAKGKVLMTDRSGNFIEKDLPKGFEPKKTTASKLTESERNASMYYNNAKKALQIIEDMEAQGFRPKVWEAIKRGLVPEDLEGTVSDPQEAKYMQAVRDFTAAKLRLESGAAIPASEIAEQAKIYMARPGETSDLIQQKAASRREALRGLEFKAGEGASKISQGEQPPMKKKAVKKQYSPSRDQTKIIYSDGSEEVVDGRQ